MCHFLEVEGSVGSVTGHLHLKLHRLQLVAVLEEDGAWD